MWIKGKSRNCCACVYYGARDNGRNLSKILDDFQVGKEESGAFGFCEREVAQMDDFSLPPPPN